MSGLTLFRPSFSQLILVQYERLGGFQSKVFNPNFQASSIKVTQLKTITDINKYLSLLFFSPLWSMNTIFQLLKHRVFFDCLRAFHWRVVFPSDKLMILEFDSEIQHLSAINKLKTPRGTRTYGYRLIQLHVCVCLPR